MLEEEEIKVIDKDYAYSLVLIGDSPVGKSCLFKKISSGEFSENIVSTMGINKSTIITNEIGDKKMELALFDTAGREKFREVDPIPKTLTNSDAAIILYDITKKESFNHINTWIDFANKYIQDKETYTFFLMGTKSDLKNESSVSEEEAKEKCLNSNLEWAGEISSKELSQDELKEKFNGLLKIIHNRRKNKKIEEEKKQETKAKGTKAPEKKKDKGCCGCC